mmetsp:Transcript_90196/g.254456  ORF Transcript_90196/g.254456 Transcript_90196/m.254456 type:complete len:379 (-) Transcript_90196:152-1288(-)
MCAGVATASTGALACALVAADPRDSATIAAGMETRGFAAVTTLLQGFAAPSSMAPASCALPTADPSVSATVAAGMETRGLAGFTALMQGFVAPTSAAPASFSATGTPMGARDATTNWGTGKSSAIKHLFSGWSDEQLMSLNDRFLAPRLQSLSVSFTEPLSRGSALPSSGAIEFIAIASIFKRCINDGEQDLGLPSRSPLDGTFLGAAWDVQRTGVGVGRPLKPHGDETTEGVNTYAVLLGVEPGEMACMRSPSTVPLLKFGRTPGDLNVVATPLFGLSHRCLNSTGWAFSRTLRTSSTCRAFKNKKLATSRQAAAFSSSVPEADRNKHSKPPKSIVSRQHLSMQAVSISSSPSTSLASQACLHTANENGQDCSTLVC